MTRTFEDKPAVRGHVPLIIGITGSQFSGKTYSALRLATGVQRVVGGEIFGIDTEAERMRHYAEVFKFRHVSMPPPHGPLDYMAAIDHCVSKGAKVIVCDSMSHEHSGDGGVISQSETFLEEKCGDDWKCREKNLMLSLIRPKLQRKKLNRRIVQIGAACVLILCYRAEQKIKPRKGQEPEHLGWQPDSTSPLPYDMTVRFLLTPASDGRPDFNPEEAAAKLAIKNPQQFRDWFKPGLQLDEDTGERLARWAQGAPAVFDRKATTDEIWSLLGKPKDGKWFTSRYGKKHEDATDEELTEIRDKLKAA